MQLKWGGIREWRKSRTECVNISLASVCILTDSLSYWYIMCKWWAVACLYRLIHRFIAGAMKLLTRHINCRLMRLNSARMLLCSALSHGQFPIWHKYYQYVQLMVKTIIDGSRCWMDNALKWASTEGQRFVVLYVWRLNNNLVAAMHIQYLGSLNRRMRQRHAPGRILGMSVNRASTIFSFASWVIYVPIGCRYPVASYW